MDVLHVCHQYAPETRGGVESYVADITGAQLATGLDVQILTGTHVPWPTVGIEELAVDGVPVHRLHRDDLFFDLFSTSWHPGVEAAFTAFLQRHRPRVVHVHQWIRLVPNLIELCQRASIPAVVTLHDYYASCPRAFRERPDRQPCFRPLSAASCVDCVPRYRHERAEDLAVAIELFRDESIAELMRAEAVLVGVAATGALVADALGLPRDRFTVLSLGYRRRFPGLPPLAPPGPGPLRFAFWGGVAPHKGLRVLIDAAARLALAGTPRPFEVHVLGGFATPEFEAELRARAGGLPVFFHGRFATAQLRDLHPAVGVFPSTCLETFGIVLDECCELGLPCIVTDRGALADRAGAGGLVVAAGDADALAAGMRRFLVEPGLWAELRGRLSALPPDVAAHAAALDAVYAAAAARRSAGGPVVPGIPAERRMDLLFRQRRAALARLPIDDLR